MADTGEGNDTDNGVGGFADPGAGTTTGPGDATVTGGDGINISPGQIGAGIGALAGGALGPVGSALGGLAGRGIGNAIGGSGISLGGFGQGPGGSTPNGGSPDSNDAGHGYNGGGGYGGLGGGTEGGNIGGGTEGGGYGGNGAGGAVIQNNAPFGPAADPNAGGGAGGAGPGGLSLTSLAQADANAGTNNYNLGAAQYAWGQNQFNTVWPYAQQYLQSQINNGNDASALARGNAGIYATYTAPTLEKFTDEANNYNSKAQADINAGGAMADVANSFESARQNALSNLESYGIDPSQTRFGALDLSSRIGQAAATAAAGTQSRLQTQATGMGLQGQAINAGMNLPGMANAGFNTGANIGSSGLAGANNTTTTGATTMGTPTQYSGLGTAANTAGSNSLYQQGNLNNTATANANQLTLGTNSLNYSKDQNNSSGIGSLIGGALGSIGSFLGGI